MVHNPLCDVRGGRVWCVMHNPLCDFRGWKSVPYVVICVLSKMRLCMVQGKWIIECPRTLYTLSKMRDI